MDFLWATLARDADDSRQDDQVKRAITAQRSRSIGLLLMMTLTFVTGVVDAVGYLGLDRVFAGNMTGNIVILGMGIAGADELPVLGPGIALLAFAVGAFVAGLVLRESAPDWHHRITVLLTVGGVALAALVVVLVVVGDDLSALAQVIVAAAIATVMGEQAAVARRLAIKDMTTVVVTSTLTALAAESLAGGGKRGVLNRRLGAIALIFAGAVSGALLLTLHIAVPLALASVLTLIVAGAGHRYLRRRA